MNDYAWSEKMDLPCALILYNENQNTWQIGKLHFKISIHVDMHLQNCPDLSFHLCAMMNEFHKTGQQIFHWWSLVYKVYHDKNQ